MTASALFRFRNQPNLCMTIDLNQQVAGATHVLVGEVHVEVWSSVHTALRSVLHQALADPKLQSLGLSPQNVTIERFDPEVGLVQIAVEE